MDLAAPQQPLPLPALTPRLAYRSALVAAAAVAAAGALGLAASQASAPAAGNVAVHRLHLGPAGVEYYASAIGERVTDAYLDLGRDLPFAYAKAGPFFFVLSSSDGAGARLTLGADIG